MEASTMRYTPLLLLWTALSATPAQASTILATIEGELRSIDSDRPLMSMDAGWEARFGSAALDGSYDGRLTLGVNEKYVNHRLTHPDWAGRNAGNRFSFYMYGGLGGVRLIPEEFFVDATVVNGHGTLVVDSMIEPGSPNVLSGTGYHVTGLTFEVTDSVATHLPDPINGDRYRYDVDFVAAIHGEPGEIPEPASALMALTILSILRCRSRSSRRPSGRSPAPAATLR